MKGGIARGFNYSVNISENSDFGQNMTFFTYFIAFYLKYFFVGIHILNKKYKIYKSVILKIVEL